MKKLVLVLAIALIAVPALATVTLTESAKNGTTVTVGYNRTTDVGLPRAFALVLNATGGTITSVTPSKTGVSTAAAPGYGIFPGTIDLTDVNNPVWHTPVEPNALPGGGALTTHRVIVALGALYKGDANKPGNSGALFTVVCSPGTTSLNVSEEETYRGGVVDVNAVGLTVSPTTITFLVAPGAATNGTPTGTSVALGTDLNWTAGSNATSHDVYFGTSTSTWTMTNVAMPTTTFDTGTMANGQIYYCRVVARNSAGTSANLDWNFTTVAAPETITTPTVAKTTASPAIAGRVNAVRSESFTASGATSSKGHTLQYQFNWGDGSPLSAWGAATQTHTFTTATTKTWTTNVIVQARCAADTAVVSSVSAAIAETGECIKSTAPEYTSWAGGGALPWNRPDCWGYQRHCRGDLNGLKNTYWVYTQDLAILKDGYGKPDSQVTGNRICGDINHTKNTYRVYTQDLAILKAYYGKPDSQDPVCPSTYINFWTN